MFGDGNCRICGADLDINSSDNANKIITEFKTYIEANKDEFEALKFYFNESYKANSLCPRMIKEVFESLKIDKPLITPIRVWEAYQQLGELSSSNHYPRNLVITLISLLRRITGLDETLINYSTLRYINFNKLLYKEQTGNLNFNQEQVQWLETFQHHIIEDAIYLKVDDLDYHPFDSKGGRDRAYQVFGDKIEVVLNELNEALNKKI